MDIRIYCTNCHYQWMNTNLAFVDPEETWKTATSISLSLPVTSCVKCGAMQWQAQLTQKTREHGTMEHVAEKASEQAMIHYQPLDRFGVISLLGGMGKQTAQGIAKAPATLPSWVQRDREGCQEAEENDAW